MGQVFKAEYLDDFIPQGGSVVRFLSGGEGTLASAASEIQRLAESGGFHFVPLDPGQRTPEGKNPDFHKLENFYFALARTIQWQRHAQSHLLRIMESRGIYFPSGIPVHDYEQIASANDRTPDDLLNEYQRIVTQHTIRDYKMARDFRVAMAALGRSKIIPDEMSPSTEEVLLGWLNGQPVPGSASVLKRLSILERINKSNAKFMLMSLCSWLLSTGSSGLLVLFDFRPYERLRKTKAQFLEEQNAKLRNAIANGASQAELESLVGEPVDPYSGPYYSQSAYLNILGLLRHLIDDVERLPGLALIVLGSSRFFNDRQSFGKERRFTDYDALQTRIGLEVHDVERQNPSAALAYLEEE